MLPGLCGMQAIQQACVLWFTGQLPSISCILYYGYYCYYFQTRVAQFDLSRLLFFWLVLKVRRTEIARYSRVI